MYTYLLEVILQVDMCPVRCESLWMVILENCRLMSQNLPRVSVVSRAMAKKAERESQNDVTGVQVDSWVI